MAELFGCIRTHPTPAQSQFQPFPPGKNSEQGGHKGQPQTNAVSKVFGSKSTWPLGSPDPKQHFPAPCCTLARGTLFLDTAVMIFMKQTQTCWLGVYLTFWGTVHRNLRFSQGLPLTTELLQLHSPPGQLQDTDPRLLWCPPSHFSGTFSPAPAMLNPTPPPEIHFQASSMHLFPFISSKT